MGILSIGVIGLGIGERYLDIIAEHPHSKLTYVCDFDEKKLNDIHQKYPTAKITIDAGALLCDPNIDIVMIASYDQYHFDQVMLAIKNNKHIFVEKPLCLTIEQAREIKAALALKPQLRISSNLVLRTCPKFKHLREEILNQKLGDVYHLEADYLWGRLHKLVDGWRQKMDFYSIIYGASIHMIDLTTWLLNKKPVQVMGLGNKIVAGKTGFRFNDFSVLLLKFEDGSSAKISAHGGCAHPHFHQVSVYGSKKVFSHNLGKSFWTTDSDPNVAPQDDLFDYPAKNYRGEVVKSFLDSVYYKKDLSLVTERDIFDSMSICFAAQKATENQLLEQIEYL